MKNIIKNIMVIIVMLVIAIVCFNNGKTVGVNCCRDSERNRIKAMEIGDSYSVAAKVDGKVIWWEVVRTR